MFRNALQRFLYGRYGSDQLNLFLMVSYLVLLLLSVLPGLGVLEFVSFALVAVTLFRTLSRNLPARRAENAKFLKLVGPVTRWYRLQRTILRDKEHRYFKCPNCGQQLRVPRGKGKISVNCRSCGSRFEKKS